jgi:hypothetical protein
MPYEIKKTLLRDACKHYNRFGHTLITKGGRYITERDLRRSEAIKTAVVVVAAMAMAAGMIFLIQ